MREAATFSQSAAGLIVEWLVVLGQVAARPKTPIAVQDSPVRSDRLALQESVKVCRVNTNRADTDPPSLQIPGRDHAPNRGTVKPRNSGSLSNGQPFTKCVCSHE